MSRFDSVRQAREAGFSVCRIDSDGILVRRATTLGELFAWVPRPARYVYGAKPAYEPAVIEMPPQKARSAPSKFWFPPL